MTQHLKPRSAVKVLYQGDDMARLAELDRAVKIAERQAAQSAGAERLGDDFAAVVAERKREFDEFVDEASARALEVVFQSIGRKRFAALVEAHPPRMIPKPVEVRQLGDETPQQVSGGEMVEHEEDAGLGVNTGTFPRALLTFRGLPDDEPGVYVTIASPTFKSQREVEDFVDDELAEGDFDELWMAAYVLNRGPSGDPKALRSVALMSDSPSMGEM